jgi:asparagine synthase (glutamine-hydrolysing)
MCGIAAYFAYGGNAPAIDRTALIGVSAAMSRRGPVAAGEWVSADGRLGLAHRRLAIIDLSADGLQPMALHEGCSEPSLVVTFNGEIYNYRELRTRLTGRGHAFRTNSDTEVLLHLYKEHGLDMVEHLRGMFAFALWDGANQKLVLARDPFGIKPLYYADDGSTIRIASVVKALMRDPKVGRTPEPAGHVGFLVWGHVPEPYTLYREIRSLPAGSMLVLQRNGERQERCYFDPAKILSEAEAQAAPVHQAKVDLLGEKLRRSVARHLVADTPVGIFLSAGIDSSVLAALASEESRTPPAAITLGFREFERTSKDEVPLAGTTARNLGLKHHVSWITPDEFRGDIELALDAMDQPTTDGLNTFFVSKAAHQAGLKVALSGVGGDELFGGYPSFREIPRLVRALAPVSLLPCRVAHRLGSAFRLVGESLIRRQISPKYASLFEYGSSYSGAYLLRRGLFMPWELPQIIDADMARVGWKDLHGLATVDRMHNHIRLGRTKVMACELGLYMRSQLLRQTDWAGMAHSVEIRTPLVDSELFRALAPALVSSDPLTKTDLASVGRWRLPPAVLSRPKTGFEVPIATWLGQRAGRGGADSRDWARHVYAHATDSGAVPLAGRR